MSNVLIVSKTRMHEGRVCVGGLDIQRRTSVRLLNENGYHEDEMSCPYNIYDIWEIEYVKESYRPLPHSNEDANVYNRQRLGTLKCEINMLDFLRQFRFNVYEGDIYSVFNSCIRSDERGSLFVTEDKVPNHSTCFWLCDRSLTLEEFYGKKRFVYRDGLHRWGCKIAYVGMDDPLPFIPGKTLVRLSLAHWWQKSEDVEERCYLQLSGFYAKERDA